MKISTRTLDVLKNFSEINQSILIKKGKKLKTVSALKNILAHAEVEEDFPQDFAIYQLNEFIGVLSTMNNPDLTFHDKYVMLSQENGACTKYFYADPSVVVSPEKDITMPSEDINFTLLEKQYNDLLKMSSILQLNDILVKGCSKLVRYFWLLPIKRMIHQMIIQFKLVVLIFQFKELMNHLRCILKQRILKWLLVIIIHIFPVKGFLILRT